MKNMSTIINNLDLSKQGDHSLQNKVPPIVKTIVDSLFDQLAFVFPAWRYTWDTEEKIKGAKKEWVKAFFENDITTKEQIAYGLKKARKMDSDFLPSCGKFISWCTPSPEDLGYPSEQQAMSECVKHRNDLKLFGSNARPFIVELCKQLDWWLINTASSQVEHKKAEKHFKDEYLDLINSEYQEPVETSHERLETREVVNKRMSPQQKEDGRKRGLNFMNDVRKQLARKKLTNIR
ncbi:MAG: hypothetical protein COA43_14615 [Robiginitomaculum sp.]|nr:MAG: hypothetical protein COA43_14615 [Robiginitomaculum sp.]